MNNAHFPAHLFGQFIQQYGGTSKREEERRGGVGSDNQLSKAEERKMESYDAGGRKIALDVRR